MIVYNEGEKVFFIASTPGNYAGAFSIGPGEICAITVTGRVDPVTEEQYNSYVCTVLFRLESSTGQGTNEVMSQKAVTDALNLKFDKSNIITSAASGVTGDNNKVASDKELNARLAQIRAEMAQIGGFSTAYTTLDALEAAAEAGQLDARKIYLIPLDEEGPTDVYSEYILITAQGQLYKCDECGYVYNPDNGDPDHGVPPGTPFADLPSGWVCPSCENTKDNFTAIAGYVERIGSTSLDMDAITNAEIDQAFVDNGMVPAS
jgi:rubredoxin